MNPRQAATIVLSACLWVSVLSRDLAATPLGTAFTYQGQLEQNGQPVNRVANMRFLLWNDPSATAPVNQVGVTQIVTGVNVTNGLFTIALNADGEFGPKAFNGEARWLEVDVCTDASCTSLTILSPRQPLTAAPYAAFSAAPWETASGSADISYTAGNVGIGTNSPTTALHVNREPIPPEGTMALEGTTHSYLTFFPQTFANGRKAFIGFPSALTTIFSVTNQFTGGHITLGPGPGGNVGIDTAAPAAKLDVRGDIRLGATGQLFAPGGQENLRMVRGNVSAEGHAIVGAGFTATRLSEFLYTLTFTPPFSGTPTVTVTCDNTTQSGVVLPMTVNVTRSSAQIQMIYSNGITPLPFGFIALGPR